MHINTYKSIIKGQKAKEQLSENKKSKNGYKIKINAQSLSHVLRTNKERLVDADAADAKATTKEEG